MTKKGVLHPEKNEFVGENEKMRKKDRKRERKWKEKKTKNERKGEEIQLLLVSGIQTTRSELVCAPRGRGTLLLWLFFV